MGNDELGFLIDRYEYIDHLYDLDLVSDEYWEKEREKLRQKIDSILLGGWEGE